jgi:hypothetical protein
MQENIDTSIGLGKKAPSAEQPSSTASQLEVVQELVGGQRTRSLRSQDSQPDITEGTKKRKRSSAPTDPSRKSKRLATEKQPISKFSPHQQELMSRISTRLGGMSATVRTQSMKSILALLDSQSMAPQDEEDEQTELEDGMEINNVSDEMNIDNPSGK